MGSRPNPPLRPLQAAPVSRAGSGAFANAGASGPRTWSKKRENVKSACEACRNRKSKCTAERPACSLCVARGERCIYRANERETHTQALKRKYDELQVAQSTYERIFEMLASRPSSEAEGILQRIREGVDPESILRHIQDGDLLLQLSLTPERRYRYEFPYKTQMPSFLLRPDNPYLNTLIYDFTSGRVCSGQDLLPPVDARVETLKSPYLTPYHTAEIVDPQLELIKPAKWTNVSSDDKLMRKLFKIYFLSEYHWIPFFHKDYFLKDMIAGHRRFCSHLLVNAILAYACHCHRGIALRAEFWNPQNLGYRFLAEAKRLWELEVVGRSKLTTVQAALVLNVVYNMNGADKLGYLYTEQAIVMANNLQLFSARPRHMSDSMQNARGFTAWALFLWQGMCSYMSFVPILAKKPPETPLPDPLKHTYWYGEFWVKYPSAQMLFPTHFAQMFYVKAQLWMIAHAIISQSFNDEDNHVKLSVDQVLSFHSKLVNWYNNLPEALQPKNIVMPFQLQLHMHYHNFMINILDEPMTTELEHPAHIANAIKNVGQHPREYLTAVKYRFETLLRLYYLRHSFEALDVFMIYFLNLLSYMARKDLQSNIDSSHVDDIRATLILAVKGLRDQSSHHYLGQVVSHIVRQGMRPEDVELFERSTGYQPTREKLPPKGWQIQSQWPINLTSVIDDPESQRLEKLIKDYNYLATSDSSEQSETNSTQ